MRRRLGSILAALWAGAACSAPPPATQNEALHDPEELEGYLIAAASCFPRAWWLDAPGVHTDLVFASLFADGGGGDLRVPYVGDAAVRECVLRAAGDCDAVRACVGLAIPEPATAEECAATAPRCDGSVAVSCADDGVHPVVILRQDCRARTLSCIAGQCAEACGSEAFSCRDDRTGIRCGTSGAGQLVICVAGTECGASGCEARGQPCSASACEGDVLVVCDELAGRSAERWDCASAGMRCGLDPEGTLRCLPSAAECAASDALCDGDVLTYCGPDGRARRYDCLSHGFARCGLAEGRAICVPLGPRF